MKKLIAVLACLVIPLCGWADNAAAGSFEALFDPSFKGWRAAGGDAVSTAVIDDKTVRKFSGDLSKVKDRISWDVNGPFDLSKTSSVILSLQVDRPDSISIITFYFNTSSGRYRFNVLANNIKSGWNVVNIIPGKLDTEGNPSGLNAITSIRISAWKKSDDPVNFCIMPGGVLPEQQSSEKTADVPGSAPAANDAAGELIANSSLENVKNGLPAGYFWNGTAAKVKAEAKVALVKDAHTGENAIAVTRLNDAGEFSVYAPFKKIEPSASPRYFVASVWMKTDAQSAIRVYIQASNSKWSRGFHAGADVHSSWKQFFLLMMLEPGQDISFLRMKFTPALIGDTLFMDDFSLREISAAEHEKIKAAQQNAGKITWNKVNIPGKNTAGCNLLRNSSFENGLEHWGLSFTMTSRPRSEFLSCDSKEKVNGEHSMRYHAGTRWYDAGGRVQSPPIPVVKGKRYTFSAYMKCNEPGLDGALEVRYRAQAAPAVSTVVRLTDAWKRYVLSFEAGECPDGIAVISIAMPGTWMKSKTDFSKRSVWIDAVQFEEGGVSEYAPAPVVEMTGSTPSANALFVEDEPVTLVTRINVPDALVKDNTAKWNLEYTFENIFGEIADARSFEIEPGGRAGIEHSCVWDTKLLGSYCAHMKLKSGNTVLAEGINVFAIMPKLPDGILKDSGLFGVNTTSSEFLVDVVGKMGVGSIRLHDDSYMRWTMLRQDKDDPYWYEPEKEKVLQHMKSTGVYILGNMELGSIWASTAPDAVKGWERAIYPPALSEWRMFVHELATHFKNTVDAWEIWNEPYLDNWWKGTAPQYVAILDAANQEIRNVESSTPVVGICGQAYFNGWDTDCLKAGALKSMNVFSFHDYVSKQSGPVTDWLKNIETMKQKCTEAGKNIPIWNTECGVGEGHDSWYTQFYSGKKAKLRLSPALLVQTYVTSLAGGIDRLYWYWLMEDWGPAQTGCLGMLEYNGTPKPVIPAFTVCVKNLAGKTLAKRIDMGKDINCFIFAGNGRPVAVIWQNIGIPAKKIVLPANSVSVSDIMGNALPEANGKIAVEVSAFPHYVQGNGSVEELAAAIK